MKIIEAHIYGYGKLENVKFSDLQGLNVLYGENEAGKSTLMSFIHAVLFGFPTRQQTELRYEPKTGSKYGGQLTIDFNDKGIAVVERVRGRAAGDVAVVFEDGTRGGEELLKELLFNIDKSLYQSIFSFNLQGLQNVHQLKSEDLGRFLFSTGAIGSDSLLKVDTFLQKELDNLYKPNGKKPYINEKLTKLRHLQSDLKRAEQHNETYWQLVIDKDQLEKDIKALYDQSAHLQKRLNQLNEWKNLLPIVKESEVLREELQLYEGFTFPPDGIERLNRFEELLKPYRAQAEAIEKRMIHLKEDLARNEPDVRLIEKESEIISSIEQLPLYDSFLQEMNELKSKLDYCSADIEELKERLHITVNDEDLLKSNTSNLIKMQCMEAQKKDQHLKEKKNELDEQFSDEKQSLELIEEKIELVKAQLLSPPEKEQLEEQITSLKRKELIGQRLKDVQNQLLFLKQSEQREKKQEKKREKFIRLQILLFGAIFIGLIGWGIYNFQWFLAIIGGLGAILLLMGMRIVKSSDTVSNVKEQIKAQELEEEKLQHQLESIKNGNLIALEERLKRDETLREQLKVLEVRLEQHNAQYEKIIQGFERWENDSNKLKVQVASIADELLIPKEIASYNIYDAFLIVEKIKMKIREKRYMQEQICQKKYAINGIEQTIFTLQETFLRNRASSFREAAFNLRKQLKEEVQKQIKHKDILTKIEESENEYNGKRVEIDYLEKETLHLYSIANVDSDHQFRLAAKKEEKRKQLAEKLGHLENQLRLSQFSQQEILSLSKIIDPAGEALKAMEDFNQNHEKVSQLQSKVAEIKHEIQSLESGGEYTVLLHSYKQLREEIEMEAKVWARFALAKNLLTKTVERFKNDRLPMMLRKAESYLHFLTDGRYTRIITKKDTNGFLIKRNDSILFEANELSQGTTEQVYVSLRLALMTTVYKRYPLPIIIDDSFVNFDEKRTKKVISLLKELKENQILFFTCHPHIQRLFDKGKVIHLHHHVHPFQ